MSNQAIRYYLYFNIASFIFMTLYVGYDYQCIIAEIKTAHLEILNEPGLIDYLVECVELNAYNARKVRAIAGTYSLIFNTFEIEIVVRYYVNVKHKNYLAGEYLDLSNDLNRECSIFDL